MYSILLTWFIPLNFTDSPEVVCQSDEYSCQDGTCIDIQKLCDGKADCNSGTDEDPQICSKFNSEIRYFQNGNNKTNNNLVMGLCFDVWGEMYRHFYILHFYSYC